jgi:hypothetical protein
VPRANEGQDQRCCSTSLEQHTGGRCRGQPVVSWSGEEISPLLRATSSFFLFWRNQ